MNTFVFPINQLKHSFGGQMNRLLYCSVERATTRVFVNTCRNMIYLRFCTVCRGQLAIQIY